MSLTGTVAQKKANNNSQQPLFNVRSSSSAKWWFSSVWRVLSPENCQSLSSLESTSSSFAPSQFPLPSFRSLFLPSHHVQASSSFITVLLFQSRSTNPFIADSRITTHCLDGFCAFQPLSNTHARQFQLLFWSFASVNRNLTQQLWERAETT